MDAFDTLSPVTSAALGGLMLAIALAIPTWIVSVARHDASLADRVWSAFIAVPAAYDVWRLGGDARAWTMLAIAALWAVRLALYITVRNWGHGEDRRYRDMRERNQPGFALKSLWLVFLLQAVLGWVVSWPFLAASGTPHAQWRVWDSVGLVLAVGGLLIETVADAQLARFRRDPGHRDRVLDTGLWRYSRHPNYFGECCMWWGLGLMGVSGAMSAMGTTSATGLDAGGLGGGVGWCLGALASPLLMTWLLLRVSGVTLLERDIGERRPAYRDYIARTSAFIPWPPRRKQSP